MGIYPNHGLEYWLEFDTKLDNKTLTDFVDKLVSEFNFTLLVTPENHVQILSITKTDERLLKSHYYQERKDNWFHDRTFRACWWEKIEDQNNIDLQLTNGEKIIVKKLQNEFQQHLLFQGWYDVNKIQCSY